MKNQESLTLCIVSCLMFVSLVSCSAKPSTDTTNIATAPPSESTSALDIATALPAPTDIPTATAEPSITPTPIVEPPMPLKDLFTNVRIKSIYHFDNLTDKYIFWTDGPVKISDNVVTIEGKEYWASGFGKEDAEYSPGMGVMFKYHFSKGSQFEYYLDVGDWDTTGYKRYGIYQTGQNPSLNLWEGKNWLKGGGNYLNGNLKSKPEDWKQVALAIGKDGTFTTVIWDPADPSQIKQNTHTFGEKWSSKTWRFIIGANKGTIIIDDYCEFSFDDTIEK